MQWFNTSAADVAAAAAALRGGAVIAFPTETVYGLGADASQDQAVRRVFRIKGRPATHPLILHIASVRELPSWADPVPACAGKLAARFWPGPLTLVLPRAGRVSDVVTGGQDTVAVRVPDHPLALALLAAFDGALAAPSANLFGRTSPTCAAHVHAQLEGAIDGLMDGGPCRVGIESTILDLTGARARILRPGMITAQALAEVLGYVPEVAARSHIRVPGSHPGHYAPAATVVIAARAALAEVVWHWSRTCPSVHALLAGSPNFGLGAATVHVLPDSPDGYAARLYDCLHQADRMGADVIVVERPPASSGWEAIGDRLERAAARPREAGEPILQGVQG